MYDTYFKQWTLNTTVVETTLMFVFIALGSSTWWILGLFAVGFFAAWLTAVAVDR